MKRNLALAGLALTLAATTLTFSQPDRAPRDRQPGDRRAPGRFTPEQFVERMMANDSNGDGKLSKDELPGQMAERLFEAANTNGDEFLDSEELAAYAETRAQRGRDMAPGGEEGGPGMPTSVRGAMQRANRAWRALRDSPLDDASKEDDLARIQAVETSLVAAKGRLKEVPKSQKATERFGEDDIAYYREFRLTLIKALAQCLEVETAILNGDSAAAQAALSELGEIQRGAHSRFRPQRERGEGEDIAPDPGEAPDQPRNPRRPGRGGGNNRGGG